jgi:hypothetical protein
VHLDFLIERFHANREENALVWQGKGISYGALMESLKKWINDLDGHCVQPGGIVGIESYF